MPESTTVCLDTITKICSDTPKNFDITTIMTLVGIIVAASVAIIIHYYQQNQQTKISRATFWLELEKMFQHYDELYLHLRFEVGDWFCQDVLGPYNNDLPSLWDYLGLFEHCNILIKQGIIDIQTFESIYKTRVMGILSNKTIREKELKDKTKWSDFYDLLNRLQLTDTYGNFMIGLDMYDNPVVVKARSPYKQLKTSKDWEKFIKSNIWRKRI